MLSLVWPHFLKFWMRTNLTRSATLFLYFLFFLNNGEILIHCCFTKIVKTKTLDGWVISKKNPSDAFIYARQMLTSYMYVQLLSRNPEKGNNIVICRFKSLICIASYVYFSMSNLSSEKSTNIGKLPALLNRIRPDTNNFYYSGSDFLLIQQIFVLKK